MLHLSFLPTTEWWSGPFPLFHLDRHLRGLAGETGLRLRSDGRDGSYSQSKDVMTFYDTFLSWPERQPPVGFLIARRVVVHRRLELLDVFRRELWTIDGQG